MVELQVASTQRNLEDNVQMFRLDESLNATFVLIQGILYL